MKSLLAKPVVWNVLWALVIAAIAIKLSIWVAALLWLVAAIREPSIYLYPFLLPAAVGVFYTGSTKAAIVVGSLVVAFALYRLWRVRSQRGPTAPVAAGESTER